MVLACALMLDRALACILRQCLWCILHCLVYAITNSSVHCTLYLIRIFITQHIGAATDSVSFDSFRFILYVCDHSLKQLVAKNALIPMVKVRG